MVVGIVLILLGLASVAIFKHQRDLRQKEYDSQAEIIYQAAQNRLTKLRLVGASASYGVGRNEAYLEGNGVYSLDYTPSDYTSSEDPNLVAITSDSKDSPVAQAILPRGAVDDTIYFDYWVIEYNIDSASVYAAYYGKDAEKIICGKYIQDGSVN